MFRFFRNRRRLLFSYWDGARKRRVDPLLAFRAMWADEEFRPDVHPDLCDEGDSDAIDATMAMMDRVFGIKQFDDSTGKGLTHLETMAVFNRFCWYIVKIKKNTNTLPTRPRFMDVTSEHSSEATTNDSPPVASCSDEISSAEPTCSERGTTPP